MNPTEKNLWKDIFQLVKQQLANSLQPSSGKNYIFFTFKTAISKKWVWMNEWKLEMWVFYKVKFTLKSYFV